MLSNINYQISTTRAVLSQFLHSRTMSHDDDDDDDCRRIKCLPYVLQLQSTMNSKSTIKHVQNRRHTNNDKTTSIHELKLRKN